MLMTGAVQRAVYILVAVATPASTTATGSEDRVRICGIHLTTALTLGNGAKARANWTTRLERRGPSSWLFELLSLRMTIRWACAGGHIGEYLATLTKKLEEAGCQAWLCVFRPLFGHSRIRYRYMHCI